RAPTLSCTLSLHDALPISTLLRGLDENKREAVVLAYQRYGRGKSMVFNGYDSGVAWQLNAKIPVEDMTHETFWRQLLRWLVDGVDRKSTRLNSSHSQISYA